MNVPSTASDDDCLPDQGGVPAALYRNIGDLVKQLEPQLVAWRRHLHRTAELSYQEHETARYIRHQLDEALWEVTSPTPTSVLATLRTGRPGPVVAVRADIDALAVQEDTGLPFASEREGVMHACGHDGHAAAALAISRVLGHLRERLTGEVRLIFQHAEEQVPSGAQEVIDAGALDGVDVVLGQHLWVPLEAGRISVRSGPVMASTDYFDILLEGRGGHVGLPHQTIDTVAVAAQVVTNLQHVVSRTNDPLDPLVASVTGIHAGGAPNVVPGQARVHGTIRTLDPALREAVVARLERIVHGVAAAHEAQATVEFRFGPPPVLNHSQVTAALERSVRRQLGESALTSISPVMGGDDFAFYQERVPGAYLLVGAGTADPDRAPHHHPRFQLDESALAPGVRVLCDAVVSFCAEGARPLTTATGTSRGNAP